MAVRVERKGPVTTVVLDRPEVRNAVDGPTATALAEAFADFDAEPDASVAVLFGTGGTFCAGADLKAMGSPNGNRTDPGGSAPMGPTRMQLSKPVIAAISGHAVAGGLERPAGGAGGRRPRRVLPPLGRAAYRWRHGAATPGGRARPGTGHDHYRSRRARRGGLSDGP